MKRITLILDGSADRPNAALMNKTPLAAANTKPGRAGAEGHEAASRKDYS